MMDPVNALAKLALGRKEIYHADGHGHVQCEDLAPSFDFGNDPAFLLSEINRQNLWPDFYKMLSTQPEQWQLDLIGYLPGEQDYSIEYIVKLVSQLQSSDQKTALMQQIRGWSWTAQALKQAPKILADFKAIKQDILCSDKDKFSLEWERQMCDDVINELQSLLLHQ